MLSFKKAAALASDQPEIHNNLGIAYEKLKQYKDAERAFRKVLKIDPDYKKAQRSLQRVLGLQKQESKEKNFVQEH